MTTLQDPRQLIIPPERSDLTDRDGGLVVNPSVNRAAQLEVYTGFWGRTDETPQTQDAGIVLERRFTTLAERWRNATGMYSLDVQKVTDPFYLRIIAMGPKVIPLILQELRLKGGHWFLALEVLAEESPVLPADVGNINRMKSAWIQWGIQRG